MSDKRREMIDALLDKLEEIDRRGYYHKYAVTERLSLIAEILIVILLTRQPSTPAQAGKGE